MINKFLSFYTRFFTIWVILFAAIAYLIPAPFIHLKNYMDCFFATTMFGIGATLHPADFRRILNTPFIVVAGSIAQFTIMPFSALGISKLLHLPEDIALGLILTGCAPGAMSSNVISYLAKADTAYSVSLTAVSTLLAPILTPALTYLLAHSILKVSFSALFFSVIKIVIAPLLIGFAVKYVFKNKINRIIKIFPAISVTFIIFICCVVIALNKNYFVMITGIVVVAALTLNITGMCLGYLTGLIFKMDESRRRTLSIEIGMQNAGLGTVLALKHFGEKSAIPAAIYVFICIITASAAAQVWKKSVHKP